VHCKRCDYPLWDLAARVCPECGLGFSPTEYEFVVNSVRFMCPHCRQAYYGTAEGGHLWPRRFACVKCTKGVDESEMVLLPTAGVSEVQTVGGVVPWRERATRGRFKSFFKTIGLSAFLPHRLAKYCGQTTSPGEAWWFGMLVVLLSVATGIGWMGVFCLTMQYSRLGIQAGGSDILDMVLNGALWLVLPPLGIALIGLLWTGAAHLIMTLGNPRAADVGFARTAECFGYALGSSFLIAVPCLGMYMVPLAAVWVAVSAIVQLVVRNHGVVSVGRVVWGVLALPLLAVAALIGWIGFAVAYL